MATILRFPRYDLSERAAQKVWRGIPRLDLSKIRKSRWLIDMFLAEGSIQLVYGSYGTRKTTAMLLGGWSVALREDFLGRKTRQRCVLFLDYENPADVLKSYCQDLGIDPSHPRFTIWDRLKGEPPQPGSEILENFIERCRKQTGHFPWLIFDSWTSLLRSGDSGNAIGEAAPIFQAIRRYRDLGATCTIIDHTGHRGKLPIGTSAKMTQMDSAHAFQADEKEATLLQSNQSRAVIRVESNLKRYAPREIGTFSFEVLSATDAKGNWHLRSLQATKDKSIAKLEKEIASLQDLIRKHPTLGKEELVKLTVVQKIASRNRARKLLEECTGKYWSAQGGKKGEKHTYRVLP
jgi:RecA-family ATPase